MKVHVLKRKDRTLSLSVTIHSLEQKYVDVQGGSRHVHLIFLKMFIWCFLYLQSNCIENRLYVQCICNKQCFYQNICTKIAFNIGLSVNYHELSIILVLIFIIYTPHYKCMFYLVYQFFLYYLETSQ